MRVVINAFSSYGQKKREEKLVKIRMEDRLKESLKLIAIKGVVSRCRDRVKRKEELRKAGQWHALEMFKKAYIAWVQYYKKNTKVIGRYL